MVRPRHFLPKIFLENPEPLSTLVDGQVCKTGTVQGRNSPLAQLYDFSKPSGNRYIGFLETDLSIHNLRVANLSHILF